jgi:hypothetical protein
VPNSLRTSRVPRWAPSLIVVAPIILGNLLSLVGAVDSNPLLLQSGLGLGLRPGLLPGFPSIDPNNGFTLQALGHLAASDWLSGRVPWWNPFEGLGAPLAGEMQSAALFLPALLLGLSQGVLYLHVLLEVVAALATYFLVRRMGAGELAAVVAGVAFGLNGTFAWLGNAAATPICFLPIALLGLEMIRSRPRAGSRLGWAILALGVAGSVYAGFPETTAIDTVLAGLWALLRLEGLERHQMWRYLGISAWGAGLGLLLAAPLIVAFLSYLPHANVGGHSGGFGTAYISRAAVAMLAMPYIFGPIFGFYAFDHSGALGSIWGNIGGFTTAGLVALASLAAWSALAGGRQRWLRLGLIAWIALAWAKTFGVPVVNQLVAHLPGFSGVAFYRYAPPSWEMAVVVLAGLGLDDLATGRIDVRVAWRATGSSLIFLLVSAVAAAHELTRLQGAPHLTLWAGASMAAALVLVLGVGVAAARPREMRSGLRVQPALAVGAAVIAEALALFFLPQLSAPRGGRVDLAPVRYLAAHLDGHRFFTLGPLAPNYGSYFGLAELNVNDLPVPSAFAAYVASSLDPNVNPVIFTGGTQASPSGPSPEAALLQDLAGYQEAGVSYVVTAPGTLPQPLGLKRVFSDPVATIYRLPGASPLITVSNGCRAITVGIYSAQVDCQRRGSLVWRELYLPGWTATLSGRPAAVRPTGTAFQRVALNPGRQLVRFSFQPPGETAGVALGGLGLLLLVGGLVADGRRRGGVGPRRG